MPEKDEKSIFQEATELPAGAERDAYLNRACGIDEQLRARVLLLLQAHDREDSFFDPLLDAPHGPPENTGLTEVLGTTIGSYKLIEKLGEGGMAVVYQAQQEEPIRRKVAMKIIKPGMDSKQVIARFAAEKQTLAMMDHPNIAKVHDAGVAESGRPYFVMEYVEGIAVTKYCDEHKLSITERLDVFKQICEGVHHAHQKGIIHRDIKPSNIVVYSLGEKAIPKIIDFGVAKAIAEPLADTQSFTRHGQLVGTPEYMSPEQVDMATQDVDTRSDIYSLGVLLYELLAGVLPYDKDSFKNGFNEIQRTIQEEEPATPSTKLTGLGDKAKEIAERRRTQLIPLARCLHKELEWIPMKAMRKDRTRRYRSASELSDDIQNYLTSAPLIAGPESNVYRARKFMHKHAGSVTSAALVAVVIVIGLITSTAFSFSAEKARDQEAAARVEAEQAREQEVVARTEAEQARDKEAALRVQVEQALARAEEAEKLAEERAEEYRRSLYFKNIALADLSYRDGSLRHVRELLDSCPDDLRAWEWHRLSHMSSDQSYMTLRGHTGGIWGVAVSSDGMRIASCGQDSTIKVWNAMTGAELATLQGHKNVVGFLSFSPDGRLIVSGSDDKTAKVWDVTTGTEVATLRGHIREVRPVSFSQSGSKIVSGSRDASIKVWDAKNGTELMTLQGHAGGIFWVGFDSKDERIVSSSMDRTIKVWDAATGSELMTLRGHEGDVRCCAIGRKNGRIASGSADKTIKIWDASSGAELMTLRGHEGTVMSVMFSPDEKRLLSAGGSTDRTIRVWDVSSGAELTTLHGHSDSVRSARFTSDGKRVVSGSKDKTIKVWDLAIDRMSARITSQRTAVALSPDGKWIASGDGMGITTIWNRSTCTEVMTLHGPKGDMVANLQFSPDGKRVFSCHIKKGTIWDIESGTELMSFSGNAGYVHGIFSPDGRYIASWISEYWDEGNDDNTIKMRDAATGEEIMTLDGFEGEIYGVVFSPNSTCFASCELNGTIKVWDAQTGENTLTLKHNGGVGGVAFSPDGSRIASGGFDQTIRLWDAQTGAEAMTLRGHDGGIASIAFSPDEKRIMSGSRDRTLKLWDALTGTQIMTLREEPEDNWALPGVEFSPDGKTIAVASLSGITLLESEVTPEGYEARRIGATARKLVDGMHKKHGFYSKVIDRLKADDTLDDSVRKIALQVANARLWEDAEKQKKAEE